MRTNRLALAIVLLLGCAPAAALAGERRQTLEAHLTTTTPDTPTGSSVTTWFADPADPEGKPHALDRLIIRSGLQLDQDAVPRCRASDAELLALGEAACPPESMVQRGRIVMDTGSPLVFPRLIHLRTSTFNAPRGYLHLGEGENFPMRGVSRSTIENGVMEVEYADAPGWGGPDHWAAMTFMTSSGQAIVRDGRAFVRTPASCPRTRHWSVHFTFVYHDGVEQHETAEWPCKPR